MKKKNNHTLYIKVEEDFDRKTRTTEHTPFETYCISRWIHTIITTL